MWEKSFDPRLNPGGQACELLHSPLDYMSGNQGTNEKDLTVDRGKLLVEIREFGPLPRERFRDD